MVLRSNRRRLEIRRDAVFTENFPSRLFDLDDNEFFLPSILDIGENATVDSSDIVMCENSCGDNSSSGDNIGIDFEYESAVIDDESKISQQIANFRETCKNSQKMRQSHGDWLD